MTNREKEESIISINCNKIRVEYCPHLELQDLLQNISEKQLNKINRWIFRYCCWFRIKDISSIWISNNIDNSGTSIKWMFNNTKNDVCIHKIIVMIMNNLVKKQGGYFVSMQRNNRGYFILFFGNY